jgi:hypothetical protein
MATVGSYSLTQGQSTGDIVISSPIAALQVIGTGTAATGFGNDLLVTIAINSRLGGRYNLAVDMDLYTLYRLRQKFAGYAIFNTAAAAANYSFGIDLGLDGRSIYLDDDLQLIVNFRNAAAAATTHAFTLTSVEGAEVEPIYSEYQRLSFPASAGSTEQPQDLSQALMLYLPITATPWTQARLVAKSQRGRQQSLVYPSSASLEAAGIEVKPIIAVDRAGTAVLYAHNLPVTFNGQTLNVSKFDTLFLTYTSVQSPTVMRPRFGVGSMAGLTVPPQAPRISERLARALGLAS